MKEERRLSESDRRMIEAIVGAMQVLQGKQDKEIGDFVGFIEGEEFKRSNPMAKAAILARAEASLRNWNVQKVGGAIARLDSAIKEARTKYGIPTYSPSSCHNYCPQVNCAVAGV